jgi:hypothetical protein
MSRRFAVVYEAEADFRTATELADRVLIEAFDWLEEYIDQQREWIGQVFGDQRLTWTTISRLARERGLHPWGHFDGQPGMADAVAARRAIFYLRETVPDLDAIVLIRDQDDQHERRTGLEQAREENKTPIVIVIGLAIVEREAWVISGFEPQNDEETARLDAERQILGIDPRSRSHELTAGKNDNATRSPKRVLQQLSGNDKDRERRCWMDTPLEQLHERGGENGLRDFLLEVKDKLAPMFGHVQRERGDRHQHPD